MKIGECLSSEEELDCGVAQGSVLGPRLFNIYIHPLYEKISPLKFNIEGFADDHQLLKAFIPCLQKYSLSTNIQDCLHMISKWTNQHFLKLNDTKTNILVIAPPSIQSAIWIRGVFVKDKCISFVNSAKNLGVLLDSELSLVDQIFQVAKSCLLFIKDLYSICSYLTKDLL